MVREGEERSGVVQCGTRRGQDLDLGVFKVFCHNAGSCDHPNGLALEGGEDGIYIGRCSYLHILI